MTIEKLPSDYDDFETTTLSPNIGLETDTFDEVEKKIAIPQSVCSLPCKLGYIMIFNTVSAALTFDKIRGHNH